MGIKVARYKSNDQIIGVLKDRYEYVQFAVGQNHTISFPDVFFDYALLSGAFYYLAEGVTIDQNVNEVARVLRSGGIFFLSLVRSGTVILRDAEKLTDIGGGGNI